jgi:threonine dehydratase
MSISIVVLIPGHVSMFSCDVSHHSTRLGINGVIVMPTNAPFIKVKTTKEFGAKVVLAGGNATMDTYTYKTSTTSSHGLGQIRSTISCDGSETG